MMEIIPRDFNILVVFSEESDTLPEWARTIYQDKDGKVYLPACPEDLQSKLAEFLQRERIDYILSTCNHIYIGTSDILDIFPDSHDAVAGALEMIKRENPATRVVH